MYLANKKSRGQFFSLDVIAGSLIFFVAFFLLAFYWLNAQAGMGEKTDDLQREAERIADQLMTPGKILPTPNGWASAYIDRVVTNGLPPHPHIDDYGAEGVPYIHLVREDETAQSKIACILVWDLAMMSSQGYYAEVKEKLGIPRYEFYITLEDNDGAPVDCAINYAGNVYLSSASGFEPPANAREIANAERIVLIDKVPFDPSNPVILAKLRVQVWRP